MATKMLYLCDRCGKVIESGDDLPASIYDEKEYTKSKGKECLGVRPTFVAAGTGYHHIKPVFTRLPQVDLCEDCLLLLVDRLENWWEEEIENF